MSAAAQTLDTLTYANHLKTCGFTQPQAEGMAHALAEFIGNNFATKNEIEDLRIATKNDIKELRISTKNDIEELRISTKNDIEELRLETKDEIGQLRHEIKDVRLEIRGIKQEIAALFPKLFFKVTSAMVVTVTLASTLLGVFIKILH